MTTSAFQQSDYKANIDQTDRHLHVTSGSKELEVKEQSFTNKKISIVLSEILVQMKITNKYLAEMMECDISEIDK